MRFEGGTPASRLLGAVMPWMRGRRPAWMIRLGLFLYDHLGGRRILPGTSTLDLTSSPEGAPLQGRFEQAFEYSDCWIEDARLVALNARDAEQRGAVIMVGTKMVAAQRKGGLWNVTLEDQASGKRSTVRARALVNAGGPWVADILQDKVGVASGKGVRLVRGSHIVTKRLFDHDKCYFFQGKDGRIIFAIPYETDFTLIGTTDADHPDPWTRAECTPQEQQYLVDFANDYFRQPISRDDIVWSYSGVRPLYDDGAGSATAATRDYVLSLDDTGGAPLLNVFGGKITTYRRLAEDALDKLSGHFPGLPARWTAGVALPGGDFPVSGVASVIARLQGDYAFLSHRWAQRLVRAYGTEAWDVLGKASGPAQLGKDFGATLTAREVDWLIAHEFARRAEDVVWRRSKLGLRMEAAQIEALDRWMQDRQKPGAIAAAE